MTVPALAELLGCEVPSQMELRHTVFIRNLRIEMPLNRNLHLAQTGIDRTPDRAELQPIRPRIIKDVSACQHQVHALPLGACDHSSPCRGSLQQESSSQIGELVVECSVMVPD